MIKIGVIKYSNEDLIKQLKEHYSRNPNITKKSFYLDKSVVSPSTIATRFGSWSRGLKKAGILELEKKKLTKKIIINQLKKCYSENPNMKAKDFEKDRSVCSVNAVTLRFGSWNNALKEAGIKLNTREKWSNEEILKQLREHYSKTGNITVESFDNDKGVCSTDTVKNRFGSWSKGLKKAGILILEEKKLTKEKITEQINDYYSRNSKITATGFEKDRTVCSIERVVVHFGSWNNAMIELGYKEKVIKQSNEKLLNILRDKAKTGELLKYRKGTGWKELAEDFGLEEYSEEKIEKGYTRIKRENREFSKLVMLEEIKEKYEKTKKVLSRDFDARAIKRYFGDWKNALKEAGIGKVIIEDNKEEVFEKMKNFIEKNGRKPYHYEYDLKYNLPSIGRINHYFGNRLNLLKEFGYERGIVGREITKSQIMEMIQDFYIREGKLPQAKDFKRRNNMPSMDQIYYHYTGVSEAVASLGFKIAPKRKIYTRKEAIKGLQDFYKKERREPLKGDMKAENGLPPLSKLRSLFGTIGNAKEAAGIPVKINKAKLYTKKEVEENLVDKYLEKGRRLTIKEIDKDKELPARATVLSITGKQLLEEVWEYLEKKYKLKKEIKIKKYKYD